MNRLPGAMLLAAAATASHAEVLIDNLDQPVHNPAHVRNDFWSAQSFITPGGPSLVLEEVTLRLGVLDGSPAIHAELRADSATGPGALLTPFTLPTLTGGATQNELLAHGPVTLLPSSTYWIVLGATGTGTFDWSYAAGNGASGSGSFGYYAYSLTQGASWEGFGLEDPYMARIEVSAVPEASPVAMAGLGMLVLGWLGQRRRNAGM